VCRWATECRERQARHPLQGTPTWPDAYLGTAVFPEGWLARALAGAQALQQAGALDAALGLPAAAGARP